MKHVSIVMYYCSLRLLSNRMMRTRIHNNCGLYQTCWKSDLIHNVYCFLELLNYLLTYCPLALDSFLNSCGFVLTISYTCRTDDRFRCLHVACAAQLVQHNLRYSRLRRRNKKYVSQLVLCWFRMNSDLLLYCILLSSIYCQSIIIH